MTIPGKGGRPLKFESPEELQVNIDKYFEDIEINDDIPTISGLAFYLNTNRETLNQYRKKNKFSDSINRAKERIEIFWEKSLLTPKVTAGVCFNLKNNFGWKDKKEIDANVKVEGQLDVQLIEGRQKVREQLEKQEKDKN